MADYVVLPRVNRKLLPKSSLIGPATPDEIATIVVRVRSKGELAELSERVHKMARLPLSERRYLTHEELAAGYGAKQEDLDAVAAAASEHHLSVVHRSEAERLIALKGKLGHVLTLFPADVNRYRHPRGEYRGLKGQIKMPPKLSGVVTNVLGLDTRRIRRKGRSSPNDGHRGPGGDNGQPATFFAARYHFPERFNGRNLDGDGQTIAILELGGGFRKSDWKKFFEEIGEAPAKIVTGRVLWSPGNDPSSADSDSEDIEVMLDLEVAGAVAPKARIAVYFAVNTEWGITTGYSAAVHDSVLKPSVLSISWDDVEDPDDDSHAQDCREIFVSAAALGMTVCVCSGDHGSAGYSGYDWDEGRHVLHPACDPFVIACGGTMIVDDEDEVWNDHTPFDPDDEKNGGGGWASGGGVSKVFDLPSYQRDARVPVAKVGGKAGRGVPDLAMSASGYFTRVDGVEERVGGTSAVAPLMAALVARLNQALGVNVGFLNPFLYENADAGLFHDVTKGTNAIKDTVEGFSARAGWDACTGLGTPNGTAILRKLAGGMSVAFTDLRCLQTTDDQGSATDEPYVVFCTIDLSGGAPRGGMFRSRVFRNIDETKAHDRASANVEIWGPDGQAEVMTDPDRTFLLVGLMESDDGAPDAVMKAAFKKTMAVAGDLPANLDDHQRIAARLLKAFNAGLLAGADGGFLGSDDDRIGKVQELRVDSANIDDIIRHGKKLTKTLVFRTPGEDGKYELKFELGKLPR